MQKKLSIYETTHYETLPGLAELALEQFEQVTIFSANADIQDSCRYFPVFQNNRIKWVEKTNDQDNRSFIKQLFNELTSDAYTHFFINSLDHNLFYFSQQLSRIGRNIHTVLNVHTIHDYTINRYNSILNISESLAKKKLHRLIKNYRVLAPAMPAYLGSRLKNIKTEYIPGMFYRSFPVPDFNRLPFRIVVPGTVERKRREYEIIPTVLEELNKRLDNNHKLELVILGNSNNNFGKELEQNMRAVLSPSISLILFDTDVAYDTYSSYYSSAHIIWAPVRLNMESIRGIPEINGLSNSAGFIVDFVHYAQPSLIPSTININGELDPLMFRYTGAEDAASQLLTFIKNPDLLKLKQQEIRNICGAYTADKFREAFKRLMNL